MSTGGAACTAALLQLLEGQVQAAGELGASPWRDWQDEGQNVCCSWQLVKHSIGYIIKGDEADEVSGAIGIANAGVGEKGLIYHAQLPSVPHTTAV